MKKVTVECENIFTGEEEKVDLYFHLTEAELTMLNLSSNNKYVDYKDRPESRNVEEEIKLFEKLIEKAYGQKTENGMFIKDETAKKAFLCSPAYSALLLMFINKELDINEFVLGCLPKKVASMIEINSEGIPVVK